MLLPPTARFHSAGSAKRIRFSVSCDGKSPHDGARARLLSIIRKRTSEPRVSGAARHRHAAYTGHRRAAQDLHRLLHPLFTSELFALTARSRRGRSPRSRAGSHRNGGQPRPRPGLAARMPPNGRPVTGVHHRDAAALFRRRDPHLAVAAARAGRAGAEPGGTALVGHAQAARAPAGGC